MAREAAMSAKGELEHGATVTLCSSRLSPAVGLSNFVRFMPEDRLSCRPEYGTDTRKICVAGFGSAGTP